MNLQNIFNKSAIIFVLIAIFATACTKSNEEPEKKPSENDWLDGRTVRYTVMVVNPVGDELKTSTGIDSAIVSLVMNDSIYNRATNKDGIAKFHNLASGIVAVKITHPKYATINMIVDITAQNTDSQYDTKNLRNASTMVAMFPTEGDNMATVSGKALADLDLTAPGLENAPAGLQISSHIDQKQLMNYANHTGDGKIMSILCQSKVNKTTTNASGGFAIKVPASQSGLKVVLVCDDFAYSQTTSTGKQRHVYKAQYDTLTVISGMKHITDITFK